MEQLGIPDAWVCTPRIRSDTRGSFLEWFRAAELAADLGHRLSLGQANRSVSRRGVLRGIHFTDVPPGQAKYVTCVSGAVLDIAVDLRVGSPAYGAWEALRLDGESGRAIYLAEGLGHAFLALTDDATVVYLCSEPYAPERERGIDPLDPAIAVAWPEELEPVLSERDAGAPSLAQAERDGLLSSYAACQEFYASLRR